MRAKEKPSLHSSRPRRIRHVRRIAEHQLAATYSDLLLVELVERPAALGPDPDQVPLAKQRQVMGNGGLGDYPWPRRISPPIATRNNTGA